MRFLKKLRDIFLALLPILVIVLFVHLFFYRFDTKLLLYFIASAFLIAFGEALFLTGVDSTIIPMGELMVGTVDKLSKLFVFLIFAVIFGFFATIAEPDVAVFTSQLLKTGIFNSRVIVMFCIGAGVGLFTAFCILRIIKNIKLKYVYLGVFAIIFLLCCFVKSEYIALAFDAGGATTGMISVPFLLAIASGISSKFSKNKSSEETFGMLGMASLGPIVTVLILFLIYQNRGMGVEAAAASLSLFISVLKNSLLAIIPLAVIFLIYDLIFIKLPLKKKAKFCVGLMITFIGLYMFMLGIDLGFSPMGEMVGLFLSTQKPIVVIIFSIALGFVLTFAEPSVIVLAKQVQSATKGSIPYFVVMIGVAISMAVAILLAALRILYNINFFYIILTGYLLALVLMFFVDSMFTGLAFDSGGVASGPMTSAFILPLMIALASNTTGAINGFGLIGIVAMSPIVVIQFMGLTYKISVIMAKRKEHKKAIMLSYTQEAYSNIEKLEAEYNKLKGKRKWEREKKIKRNMLLFLENFIHHKSMNFQCVAFL